MSITIRPCQAADHETILALVERFSDFELPAWRTHKEIDHANFQAMQKALTEPETQAVVFVAEENSLGVVGFIHLQTQNDYFNDQKIAYISDLAVDKSVEGQGIGRKLLAAAEVWAQTMDCRLLTLYVFAGNDRARRIYEKAGFGQEVIKYAKEIGQ